MPSTRRAVFAAALMAMWWTPGPSSALLAQAECGPDQKTEWWPGAYQPVAIKSISAADRGVIESTFKSVEAIVRKTAYGTPRGFAVKPTWIYDVPQSRDRLSPYEIGFVVFLHCSRYDEHGADIDITFNPGPLRWSEGDGPTMRDENGDGLFAERPRTATRFGSTATFGEFEKENTNGLFVLFTAGGASPTLPVSREEYLRAVILTLEGKSGERLKAAVAMTTKTEYQLWIDGAAARKKANEDILTGVGLVDKSAAAKLRAEMEKAEKDNTEKLKKHDAEDRERLNQMKSQVSVPGDKLRAQLAAMTPAERASPAYVLGDLVPAGTPNANDIVRVNPAFYRARGSPVEPRAVLVRLQNTYKELTAQHQQMFRDFDWAALKRLVNAQP